MNLDGIMVRIVQVTLLNTRDVLGNVGHEYQGIIRWRFVCWCALFAKRLSCVWSRADLVGVLVHRSAEEVRETWDRKALQNREEPYKATHRMPNMRARRKRQHGEIWLGDAPSKATIRY